MKILAISSSADLYGSSRIFLETVRIFRKHNFEPIVVLPAPGPLEAIFRAEGFPVHVQNLGILRRKYVNPGGLLNRLSKNLKAYRFLSELHQKCQFELVYSNTLAVIVGAYWAKRRQIPHIWHIHEILPGPGPLVKLLSKMLDSSTPHPIAVSQAVADHWQPLLKKSKLEVIHNAIAYEEYLQAVPGLKNELGIPEDTVLIGMTGRINPGKGQLFFLQLAAKLLQTYPNLHFVLVGDPFPGYEPILEELNREIKDKKLASKVSYLGFRNDIPQIMASLDIFVLPSILPDSFPTVILEAMASGRPVVATLSGGAKEMVLEGETGFLIPIQNVDVGVDAVEKLISDPLLRLKMGKAARQRVLNTFSLNAFEQKIVHHLWQHLKKS